MRGAVGSSCGVSLYDIQMYDYGLTIHFVRSLLWEWRGLEFYGMIPFSSRYMNDTATNNAIMGEVVVAKNQTTHSSVEQLGMPIASLQATHLRTDVMRRTKTSELTHPNFL